MNIGIVNLYGIGNALMSGPCIKALKSMKHRVFAIVDPDRHTKFIYRSLGAQAVNYDSKKKNLHWLMWTHAKTKKLTHIAGNEWIIPPATDRTSRKGFMWKFKKHEVEYYMDFAQKLGYKGNIPEIELPVMQFGVPDNAVAIGIGYYTGERFSVNKHWGTGAYTKLCQSLSSMGYLPILVGDKKDCINSGMYISDNSPALNLCGRIGLRSIWSLLSNVKYYIGNDTGLGHLADAYTNKALFLFMKQASNPVKNAPWNSKHFLVSPSVEQVVTKFKEIVSAE